MVNVAKQLKESLEKGNIQNKTWELPIIVYQSICNILNTAEKLQINVSPRCKSKIAHICYPVEFERDFCKKFKVCKERSPRYSEEFVKLKSILKKMIDFDEPMTIQDSSATQRLICARVSKPTARGFKKMEGFEDPFKKISIYYKEESKEVRWTPETPFIQPKEAKAFMEYHYEDYVSSKMVQNAFNWWFGFGKIGEYIIYRPC